MTTVPSLGHPGGGPNSGGVESEGLGERRLSAPPLVTTQMTVYTNRIECKINIDVEVSKEKIRS
jgi:hypothetical protein